VANQWIVLKFGGTSVAGRSQWETIAALARARQAEGARVLLVCSAVAGVTNRLAALAATPDSQPLLAELLEIHRELSRQLEVAERHWLPAAEARLEKCLQNLGKEAHPSSQAALLAMGEWICTRIAARFLAKQFEVSWVDVREALEVVPGKDQSPARQWLSASCPAGEDKALNERWSNLAGVLITQGFVAGTREGGTALLGRGGSDTSAALLGGRLGALQVEIWTDVPGLFSADPHLIREARLLRELDYAEALEMAASGAKVIHPRSIRAVGATETHLLIRDLNRGHLAGTRIGGPRASGEGVKTITCQENMAVLLLQNLDARQQVGFLAGVFDVFRRRGISIDLVATSETTTTVAINCAANLLGVNELRGLAKALGALCKVEVFADCVCVNLVGHGARTALSRLREVMVFFDDHPLLMLSQSANDLCLSLLVRSGDHEALLRGAHDALIPAGAAPPGSVYGESWEQLEENQ
jgi:diaminopimelate decarboxylase/aspartate kinase